MIEEVLDEAPIYHPLLKTKLEHVKVIHCILSHKNKILLIQRNQSMRYYPGYWSGVCGVVDEHMQMQDKVFQKIEEETGLSKKEIKIIAQKKTIEYTEKIYGKKWKINPFLIEVNPKNLHFDWNCQEHAWVTLDEVLEYNLLPGLKEVLKVLFPAKID